jgi:hypothetical protein
MSAAAPTLPPMAQIRPYHDLQCPARDVEGVADEDVEAVCICPQDGRWLDPRARPVAESANMAGRL